MKLLPETEWSPKQAKVIELLAAGGLSNKDIADQAEIAIVTLYEWRKNPKFMDAVILRSREILKESLPDIYSALSGQAKQGTAPHIKLVLEHLEHLEEIKSRYADQVITFTWEPPYATDNS